MFQAWQQRPDRATSDFGITESAFIRKRRQNDTCFLNTMGFPASLSADGNVLDSERAPFLVPRSCDSLVSLTVRIVTASASCHAALAFIQCAERVTK